MRGQRVRSSRSQTTVEWPHWVRGVNKRTASTATFTLDDFEQLPDHDGQRHEVMSGEHLVTPSPTLSHQRLVRRLFVALCLWLDEHPVGEAFSAPIDVVLSNTDIVVPDIAYVSSARNAIQHERHIRGAPDLLVEVLSPATRRRDEGAKLTLYSQAGAAEYWTVDAPSRRVRIYRRDDSMQPLRLVTTLCGEKHDRLTTPLLPGFSYDVGQLFADTKSRG